MAFIESRTMPRAALFALGMAFIVSGYPAWAEEDSDKAQSECRDLLQERGFKNIDVSDMESRDDGNKIVVEIAAKRKGNERDVTCVYDSDSGEAELSS